MIIPEKLSDIKIYQYLKYQEFIKGLDKDNSDIEYITKNKVMIFFDIDENKYNNLPFKSVVEMNQIIDNLLDMKQDLIPTFTFKGVEFGLNPNFDEMSFGEMVDCDTDDALKQLTILYRPIIKKKGRKYIIEDYKADLSYYELFKNELGLDVYLGFITFFLRIQVALLSYTLNSLTEMDLDPELKRILVENGVGSHGFTTSLLGI